MQEKILLYYYYYYYYGYHYYVKKERKKRFFSRIRKPDQAQFIECLLFIYCSYSFVYVFLFNFI